MHHITPTTTSHHPTPTTTTAAAATIDAGHTRLLANHGSLLNLRALVATYARPPPPGIEKPAEPQAGAAPEAHARGCLEDEDEDEEGDADCDQDDDEAPVCRGDVEGLHTKYGLLMIWFGSLSVQEISQATTRLK